MWYSSEDNEVLADEFLQEDFQPASTTHSQRLHLSGSVGAQLSLRERICDPSRGVTLFGTVPPPQTLTHERLKEIALATGESIRDLAPDGVVVYDIQDEPSRNGETRPFPFFQTHEPRMFAQLLQEKLPHSAEPIVYRALIPNQTLQDFEAWMQESRTDFGVRNVVLVGGSRRPGESQLTIQQVASHLKQDHPHVLQGGIVIPERHRDRCDEHMRIQEKTDAGVTFFTSQIIYNADNAILLLQDYDQHCKSSGLTPARIFLTFAPFGSESTAQFLRWLGVELPEGTLKRVLSRPNLKARIQESSQICWENWKRILDASKRLGLSVPIGLSVESVSKSQMEQQGALNLFRTLRQEMEAYYRSSTNGEARQ